MSACPHTGDTAAWSPHLIVAVVKDGDELGWPNELAHLWTHLREQVLVVMASVLERGFQAPILIGTDGRLWDGHKRVAVALALGVDVPAIWAGAG
jgi:hypothetical protein